MSDLNGILTIRKRGKSFLFFAVFMTIASVVIYIGSQDEKEEWRNNNAFGFYLIHVFVIVMAAFFWLLYFNKGIVLIINEEGVWTKKYKLIEWSDLDAYYTETVLLDGFGGSNLVLVDKFDNQYIIDISDTDINLESVKELLEIYRKKHGFRNSGHGERSY